MIDFFSLENHNNLDHYNDEFLGGREEIYIDLKGLKRVEDESKISKKISNVLANLISRINPGGVPPYFMTVVASERPSVLSEVKEDMTPTFAASDRQGILWSRNVFLINGQKVAQTGHDGSIDNILPANIAGPDVISFGYIFDGTDWDRIRSIPDNADNLAVGNPGHVGTMAKLLGFDGTTYDRLRADQFNADALAPVANGGLIVNAVMRLFDSGGNTFNLGRGVANNSDGLGVSTGATNLSVSAVLRSFNGTDYDRVRSRSNTADAIATNTTGNVQTLAYNLGSNGTTFDRIKTASATNQSSAATTTLAGVQLVTLPGNWSVVNFPAAATQATASRAAGGAGVRHVCTGFTFSCSGAAAAATGLLQAVIRDGATGVGTIIWTASIQAPLADSKEITVSGLSLLGTANTAMTIEFVAAGAAGTQEAVTMYGYSVV